MRSWLSDFQGVKVKVVLKEDKSVIFSMFGSFSPKSDNLVLDPDLRVTLRFMGGSFL